jgi:hypothetical protein
MSEGISLNKSTKKKSKKGRFNFIDFLLVLIVLAIIAAAVYVFAPESWFGKIAADETQDILYTVEIVGVDQKFAGNIKESNNVIDNISKSSIGTVEAVNVDSYSELKYVYDDPEKSDGAGKLVTYDDKHNLIVTISASALYNEGEGYYIGSCRMAVGEKLSLRFPDYSCEAYCIAITKS